MAEGEGGNQIGHVEVDIDGDIASLQSALDNAKALLESFIEKEFSVVLKTKFVNTDGSDATKNPPKIKRVRTQADDVKVEADVQIRDKDVVKDVQGALLAHKFQINLDIDHIRTQIQQALGGGNFKFNGEFSGSSGGGDAAPGQRGFSEGLNQRLRTIPGLPDLISGVTDAIRQARGQDIEGSGDELRKLNELVDSLGDDVGTWVRETTGFKGRKTQVADVAGRLGIKDEEGAASVNHLATQLVRKLKGDFFEDFKTERKAAPVAQQQNLAGLGRIIEKAVSDAAPKSPEPQVFAEAMSSALDRAQSSTLEALRKTPLFANKTGPVRLSKEARRIADVPFEGEAANPLGSDARPVVVRSRQSIPGTYDADLLHRSAQVPFTGAPLQGVNLIDPTLGRAQNRRRIVERHPGGPGGGSDPEADIRAQDQLDNNRANVRRLRGPLVDATRGVNLEGLARFFERGGGRNVVREVNNGKLRELEPRGSTAGELIESEAGIRELRQRSKGRKFTLPGVKSQVEFVKPEEVAEIIARQIYGDAGAEAISSPEGAATLKKAIAQGARGRPNPGDRGAGNITFGSTPQADAGLQNRAIRLTKILDGIDDEIEKTVTAMENATDDKHFSRLEGRATRLETRRSRIAGALEDVAPYVPLSLTQGREAAAADKIRGRQSRERVSSGFGLTELDRLKNEETAALGPATAQRIKEGRLPKHEDYIGPIHNAVPEAGEDLYHARARVARETEAQLRVQYGFAQPDERGRLRASGNAADRGLFNDQIKFLRSALLGGSRTRRNVNTGEIVETEDRGILARQDQMAREDVDRSFAGTGTGRRPRTVMGDRVDRTRTGTMGGAVSVETFAAPTTSLDTERQKIQKDYDAEARKIAERKAADREARLKAEGIEKGFDEGPKRGYLKSDVDDFLYVPRVRKQGAGGKTSKRSTAGGYRPDIVSEVESSTETGRRMAEIRLIQEHADELVKVAGPARPDPSGRQRSAADDRVARIKEFASTEEFQNPLGEQIVKEASELVRQNLTGSRLPYTKSGREVPTGDQVVERYAASTQGRPQEYVPGQVAREQMAGGMYGGGSGAGGSAGGGGGGAGGGRNWGFPIPLPVFVTNEVKIAGFVARAAASPAGDEEGDGTAAPAGKKGNKGGRLVMVPRKYKDASADFEDPFNKLGNGKIKFVDKGVGIASRPITFVEPRSLGSQRQSALLADARARAAAAKAAAKAATAKTPGSGDPAFDARNLDIRAEERDAAQEDLADVHSALRKANRYVPKRGFGASVTDVLTAKFGGKGFEQQLQALDRAEKESAELTSLRNKQGDLRADKRVIETKIASTDPSKVDKITKLNKQLEPINKQLTELEPAIKRSREKFDESVKAVTKFSTVVGSFKAAAVGGAISGGLGTLQFALGNVIAQPIQAAISEVLSRGVNEVDRLSGFAGVQNRVTGDIAQGIAGNGGNASIAFNQSAGGIGLSAATAARFAPTVEERSKTIAGNEQLQKKIDLLNTFIKTREENGGRFGDKNLTEGVGGIFGIGGTAPTSELISTEFDQLPTRDAREATSAHLSDAAFLLGSPDSSAATKQKAADEADKMLQAIAKTQDVVGFFNDALSAGGESALKFSTDTEKATDTQRQAQEKAFRAIGANGLADKVREQRVLLTENGQAVTDPKRITAALQAINNPKADLDESLKNLGPQIKAKAFLEESTLNRQINQVAPFQRGLAEISNPTLPAASGFAPGDAKRFKGELGGIQQIFNQVHSEAIGATKAAKEFVAVNLPEHATEFSQALDNVAAIGDKIAHIQIGVQTAQAALAAHSYAVQLNQAKRSLADALALQGKQVGAAGALGAVQKEQYQLQRQSQALSLEQSQRQINFQKAIAGITAPGQTGEERAIRIQQAKEEAKYAQAQLDIQKKLFGLSGKEFKITVDRSVFDLTQQIGLLEQGREVTLKTAVAEKKIQALTKLQAAENAKVQAYYEAALNKANDVLELEAQFIATTERGLVEITNKTVKAFSTYYREMINSINGLVPGSTTSTNYNTGTQKKTHASGLVGMTSGPTDLGIAGEAGGEAVAIIKNPKAITGSFGGGGTTVQININGGNFSDSENRKKLIADVQAAVERGLGRKGNLLGLSRP